MKQYSLFIILFILAPIIFVNARNVTEVHRSNIEVNVKNFGAKGDGVTNDYKAIADAISFADKSLTQKTIRIPKGIYVSNQSLYIPSKIHFVGDGIDLTVIKASAPLYGLLAIKPTNGLIKVDNISVQGMTINSNNKQSSCCIQIYYAKNITIDRVKCENSINENIAIQEGSESVFIKNCKLNGGSFCLQVYGVDNTSKVPQLSKEHPHNIYIQKNLFNNDKSGSVFINGAKNIIVIGNTIIGGLRGIGVCVPYILGADSLNSLKGDKWSTENIIIEKNNIYNTEGFGVQTFYGKNISVKKNTIKGVKGLSGDKSSLTIDRTENVTVIDNLFIGTNGTLINAFITGAKKVLFSKNNLSNSKYGIQVAANWESGEDTTINESQNVIISNNLVSNTTDCGIITNGAINVFMSGNSIRKTTYGIYLMGSERAIDGRIMQTKNIKATDNILFDSVKISIYSGAHVVGEKILENNKTYK